MNKMHHLYPTSTGDPLCPLGFHPQTKWPTRCKRCYRDYKDHNQGAVKKTTKDTTSSSPSLSVWEPMIPARRLSNGSENRRSWSSTSNLVKDEQNSTGSWNSAADLSSASLSDLRPIVTNEPEVTVTVRPPRPKTYAGSSSDSYNFRRFSVDESFSDRRYPMPTKTEGQSTVQPQKLQIKGVIDKSNGASSDNDAEFIIQVRKSRIAERNGPKTESSTKVTEKPEKQRRDQEVEKLRTQLSDMRARCDRVEKEKAEILLRKLSTMDSPAKSSGGTDVLKLQKTVKDLQGKNDTLTEERASLAAKIKSLERELNLKTHKSERERAAEELRSKLKAAEALCESLMDENEDMKKEIRELEEEIYEMQDNFREEQADEYTKLKKNLEQSNKNCRVLLFKLKRIERKAELLEADKTDLEKKYEQIKRIEDVLKKVGTEYKNRTNKKPTEYAQKMQIKKLADSMEKDVGEIINVMVNMLDNRDLGLPNTSFKYDKLAKEHELLKEKLDKTEKELTKEKEAKKNKTTGTAVVNGDSSKNEDLVNLKKKLEESQASLETERKSWDSEKLKFQEEKEKLKSKLLSLSADKLKVYNEVVQLKKDLEAATSTKKDTAKIETDLTDLKKELAQEKERCKKLQEDLKSVGDKETKLARTLTTVETAKIQMENDLKQTKLELENLKNSTSSKVSDLLSELANLKKEKDKLTSQLEKEKQTKDEEIEKLKKKNLRLEKAGLNSKKLEDLKSTYEEKIANLENEVKRGTRQYEDLSSKHEKLTETKSQLEKESQLLNGQLIDHKQDYITLQAELQELRQFYRLKESEWLTLKSRLEEQLREYEKTANGLLSQDDLREENLRLKKASSSMTQQIEDLKKVNDDLSGKLQDYTRVSKVQRNLTADSSALESELRKSKLALENAEKLRKTELAQSKLRYEQRIQAISDEIKSIQAQLTRYKRERDTYKQMLEGAQRTIGELKSNARPRRQSNASTGASTEDEEVSSAIRAQLEKQIVTMEDELSETKLEASKLKTELVSEKAASEIKMAELQSRVNELEEERLLASGRAKIPGLKVRMELAWQKEREDQQRLLQETATLARDLRQTLFEVERERDKERLENKRRSEQMKKQFEEEKTESRNQFLGLQTDLIELRDAHAKLRTSNEKMRRDKHKYEQEIDDLRGLLISKRRAEQLEARNLNVLLQQVDDLMRLFPETNGNADDGRGRHELYTPTPPRRLKGPKSRESSPMLESREDVSRASSVAPAGKTEKLEYTIKKLMEVARELQESKKSSDESAGRTKKSSKRSSSIENDAGKVTGRSKPSLKRKSLSLEQTTGRGDQSIWGNNSNSNVSSLQSLNGSEMSTRHGSLVRDASMESQLSTESTQSEILDKKHSKGIFRKMTTKLTKSASLDDPSYDSSLQSSGSEANLTEALKKDKKNLKKKLSDMFKRGSKSNGLDKPDSRPPSRTSLASKDSRVSRVSKASKT
ncbi:GRIP and coiled-coil domain-containing protein 2 isoform X1 [Copidosoma floridanum]|uniref:GRIP and coiled-coil domain-containing protein 2 isoform X1 n=1 Tax=Copidosoma floridanum TaxID=29053 RepID=UPI0006C9865C|nr:GRIP and coiled-coil domain-containing protein 2 isoform X1 [Copidosoma floridanum]